MQTANAMIELLTAEEMAQADRLALGMGRSGLALMQAAGAAVADGAAAMLPSQGDIAILCGPGNNGGDGFVAARILAERGYRVRVHSWGKVAALKGDAAVAAKLWRGPLANAAPDAFANAGLIIDALFGAGLSRPLQGRARALVEAVNASGAPVLAVDLPSGVNGTSGAVMGAAVNAARTVTFFRRKPGHLLLPGRLHCGALEVADIGLPEAVLAKLGPRIFANAPGLWRDAFPVPRIDGHKYGRGHAVVVSGGLPSTGAARLAARAALRAGAGLVTIASPREALAVQAAANLAVMVRAVDGAAELARLLEDRRLNAVALGPALGVGAATRAQVSAALAGERDVVLDADALTSFAGRLADLAAALQRRGGAAVLTPHHGEFTRLFNITHEEIGVSSKLDLARMAAKRLEAVIVYKGADSVVAAPDGRAAIADNAPPWLATAGAGDVLAGMIAGLLAQRMPAFEAAAAAVWLHGEAATAFGPGLIAEDLPEMLPQVYRALLARLRAGWPSGRF